MTQVGAPRHDPIPIGEVSAPPFARLPEPQTMFARRAERLRALAVGHELGGYLNFLASLADAQHAAQDGLPAVVLPDAGALSRAREFGMPPLDRNRFTADATFAATCDRFVALAAATEMPDTARVALRGLKAPDAAKQSHMVAAVLADAIPIEAIAEHVFVASALQVHFARLAAGLDAKALVPVGDGACPSCGGPLVSSLVVGWHGAHGARFCACALCATLWNYVRIKCTVCGSTKGIGYKEIDGGPGTVKAETCEQCRTYVKVLHQTRDPGLEAVADDVASLGLDLLVREAGFRRGGVNPFLVGY
jgi:FdhE protein